MYLWVQRKHSQLQMCAQPRRSSEQSKRSQSRMCPGACGIIQVTSYKHLLTRVGRTASQEWTLLLPSCSAEDTPSLRRRTVRKGCRETAGCGVWYEPRKEPSERHLADNQLPGLLHLRLVIAIIAILIMLISDC